MLADMYIRFKQSSFNEYNYTATLTVYEIDYDSFLDVAKEYMPDDVSYGDFEEWEKDDTVIVTRGLRTGGYYVAKISDLVNAWSVTKIQETTHRVYRG